MDKYVLLRNEAILLIVDIQEKLLPVMKYGEKVIQNTNTLISCAKEFKIPIIVTEQYPQGLGKTVAEVKSNLEGALIYEKTTFSGYTGEVRETLDKINRKKIIVTGMETHVCVFQTVRDLLKQGYQVFVVKDAVCSRFKENYQNGLTLMADMGAVITTTETVFFDLMKKAGTPLFKKLSKLIK